MGSNVGINGSPAADGTPDQEPASSQGEEMVDSSISSLKVDRPMNLPEIQAAAEHALLSSITDEQLRKSLSSPEDFEVWLKFGHWTKLKFLIPV